VELLELTPKNTRCSSPDAPSGRVMSRTLITSTPGTTISTPYEHRGRRDHAAAQKIDHRREPKLIHTVRGVGYVVRRDMQTLRGRLTPGTRVPSRSPSPRRRGAVPGPPQRLLPDSTSESQSEAALTGGHSRRELPRPAGTLVRADKAAPPRAHPRSGALLEAVPDFLSSPRATAAAVRCRPTRGPSRSSRWSSCDGW